MKKNILVLSLFLISVLTISGCGPEESPIKQRGVVGMSINYLELNQIDKTGSLEVVMLPASNDIWQFEIYLSFDDFSGLEITDYIYGEILTDPGNWFLFLEDNDHIFGGHITLEEHYLEEGVLLNIDFTFDEIINDPGYICFDNLENDGSYVKDLNGNILDVLWNTYLDECGICDNDATNDGYIDACGICDNDATNDGFVDNCGICDNDATNDCVQDCNGEWGGGAGPGMLCWGSSLYCDETSEYYDQCVDNFLICDENDCTDPPCTGDLIDLNSDNYLNILELVILANFILDGYGLNEPELCMADANKDDSINILDIIFIVNLILA